MKTYNLHREQFLPISIREAWDFFSDPANLSKITPADMGFVIHTKLDGAPMKEGMRIEYTVRPMLGIPLNWVTRIGAVNEPVMFVDTQEKGPYALWEHTHTFKEEKGGIMMTDSVNYGLPLGILGDIAHAMFVKKRLNDIFDFRFKTLEAFFNKK